MKKIVLLLFVSAQAFAQNVDYNKIILPDHVQSPDFAERLVQLAWKNYPLNETYSREVTIAQYEVKKGAGNWLDIVSLQGNVNEFVINPDANESGRQQFYPKYNIRGNISLGMFLTIPYQTKQNRQQVLIAQRNLEAQKLEIRNIVMKTYNEYTLREKIYKIQTQILSDVENTHKLIEQRFRSGETTFETYSSSQGNFNTASITFLQAERDYKNTKLDLEKLIGVKLEDVR